MSIKHRILGTLAVATLAVGSGLGALPATAGDLPIGVEQPCPDHVDCGPDDEDEDLDLVNPTEDPDGGDPEGGDDPIPADATFTG